MFPLVNSILTIPRILRIDPTNPTYQFYSDGLNTADRIVFRRHAYDWKSKGKRLLEIIKADFPGRATIAGAATPLLGFNPVTFVVTGAVSAAIKDSDFMVNRGGFRCYANESDLDTPKESAEALFVMQIEMPENSPVALNRLQTGSGGDGTVPVSSGAALNCKDTIDINRDDESYLVREHEPIYKTETAQRLTFVAIENLCRLKIKSKL